MGNKANPGWQAANAERKARQQRCWRCGRPNAKRYLVEQDGHLMHRKCAKLYQAKLEAEKLERERVRQEHLKIKNFWMDSSDGRDA